MKIIYLTIAVLFVAACGSGTNVGVGNMAGSGMVKATVLNSKSFDPNITHGKIVQYKIVISADDMNEDVVATFDGASGSGVIENAPSGAGRILRVEAVNPNGLGIRQGEAFELEIRPGETTETSVKMESVPIFANVADGSAVPNTRFLARIFSDPSSSVTVDDEFAGSTLPLFDVSAESVEVKPDVATGIAVMNSTKLPSGPHKLKVKDTKTGRSSEIRIILTDGEKLKAAPFFNAGSNVPARFGNVMGILANY